MSDTQKELDRVSKELVRLESLLQRQEEDGVYDGSLYKEIDSLENRRQELEMELEIEREEA